MIKPKKKKKNIAENPMVAWTNHKYLFLHFRSQEYTCIWLGNRWRWKETKTKALTIKTTKDRSAWFSHLDFAFWKTWIKNEKFSGFIIIIRVFCDWITVIWNFSSISTYLLDEIVCVFYNQWPSVSSTYRYNSI